MLEFVTSSWVLTLCILLILLKYLSGYLRWGINYSCSSFSSSFGKLLSASNSDEIFSVSIGFNWDFFSNFDLGIVSLLSAIKKIYNSYLIFNKNSKMNINKINRNTYKLHYKFVGQIIDLLNSILFVHLQLC